MPKNKIARKSTTIDMTAMCDVAFLLLTFFMLTAKMKQEEPVKITTPTSIAEVKLEKDILTMTIDPKGRIFLSMDNRNYRQGLIARMNEQKQLDLTDKDMAAFANTEAGFGVPFSKMKSYWSLPIRDRERYMAETADAGIPCDSTTNELSDWVLQARYAAAEVNPTAPLRFVIKADQNTEYEVISRVVQTLQDQKINRFNLITGLENDPNKKKEEVTH